MVVNVKKTMMAAAGGGGYWYARIGDASNRYIGQAIYIDSNDDIYLSGRRNIGVDRQVAVRLDTNGTMIWDREYEWDTFGDGDTKALDDDSSGNLILGGQARNGQFYVYAELSKTDGTVSSHQGFTTGGTNFRQKPNNGPVIDNNDDAWFVCTGEDDGNGRVGLTVWDHSTSTIDYDKELTGMSATSSYSGVQLIKRTPNRQRVFIAVSDPSGGNGSAYVGECDTAFGSSLDWAYGVTTNGSGPEKLHVDADYLYLGIRGFFFSAPGFGFEISKIDMDNPSSREWARYMTSDDDNLQEAYPKGIATDSSGNVYVGARNGAGTKFYIHKWNSSGVYQDAFYIECDGTNITFVIMNEIAIDSNDDLYVYGYNGGTATADRDLLLVKVPSDFSLSGTYGDLTFGTGTSVWTEGASTLTWASDSTGTATGDSNLRTLDKVEADAGLSCNVTST